MLKFENKEKYLYEKKNRNLTKNQKSGHKKKETPK